jgi:hypothetical protein
VFSWRVKANLDPYYRAVYILQLIAVITVVSGLFLVWWDGVETFTAWHLLDRSLDEIRERSVTVLGQPLVVLWLLWPSVVVSALRSCTGVLVTPVAFRRLALVTWGVSVLVLAHFYVNFGDDIPARSPLRNGEIQIGFWLTGSSTVILGLLILVEGLIKPKEPIFSVREEVTGPVNDPDRLWRGDYMTCPFCGMLNEPSARSCYNCNNLLFNFSDEER